MERLPQCDTPFISSEELLQAIEKAEKEECRDANGDPILTILDLRTELFLSTNKPVPSIKTRCPTVRALFDDLRKPEVRQSIPRKGRVVTVTETGNRDELVMRYLHIYEYTNLTGLRFGMRRWIKLGYPLEPSN